jgi:LPS sulfotransferase NodH
VTPLASWLLFGGWILAVVLAVAFFMGASRVNDHADRMSQEWMERWHRDQERRP